MVAKLEVVPVCACACNKVVPVVNSQISVLFLFQLVQWLFNRYYLYCQCFVFTLVFLAIFFSSFDTGSFWYLTLVLLEAYLFVTLFFTIFRYDLLYFLMTFRKTR